MAEVRLFGGVEFRGPGGVTALSGAKQRAIAGRLALDAGRSVSADQLIHAVWGEDVPATVRASLQTHISQIRRALAEIGLPEAVQSHALGYVLDVDPHAVDLHRFEDLARRARSLVGSDPVAVVEAARQALALWNE